ncbi:hypothetical protein [Domibacillus iocasae]|uniref:Uncharacterized protein n=1 Tax=Domibacillus iocasae TaxID=1714016 RepID=A0A1E7DRZ4_9BACI|nr:hypothetical protein [Domibacillus iocasae]OES45458.1 hypothetical protein BA724_17565 [Domibacillus iocasae]
MEAKPYVLKYGEQYLRSNKGTGSVHLTSRLVEADHFKSQKSARIFVRSLMANSKGYMIDSKIKVNNVKIFQ